MDESEERCQVNGCQNPAEYKLFKTYPDGEKKWLHVCEKHEREIGSKNMRRTQKLRNLSSGKIARR